MSTRLETWSRERIEKTLREAEAARLLTRRELQVLRLRAQGRTIVAVAAELGIGAGSVRTYTLNVLAKLGAANATQAVAVGYELGILRPGDARGCRDG